MYKLLDIKSFYRPELNGKPTAELKKLGWSESGIVFSDTSLEKFIGACECTGYEVYLRPADENCLGCQECSKPGGTPYPLKIFKRKANP